MMDGFTEAPFLNAYGRSLEAKLVEQYADHFALFDRISGMSYRLTDAVESIGRMRSCSMQRRSIRGFVR